MIVRGVINGAEYCASINENGNGCGTCVITNIMRVITNIAICPFVECPAGKDKGSISAIQFKLKDE